MGGIGGLGAHTAAVKEGLPHLRLQGPDLTAQPLLGDEQGPAGPGKAPGLIQGEKRLDYLHLHRPHPLFSKYEIFPSNIQHFVVDRNDKLLLYGLQSS